MNCFAALKIQPTRHPHLISQAYYTALLEMLADNPTRNFTSLRHNYIKALHKARSIFKTPLEELKTSSSLNSTCRPHIFIALAKHKLGINKYRLAIDILTGLLMLYPHHTEAKALLVKTEQIWCLRLAKRFNNLSSNDIEYLICHMMRNKQHKDALTLLNKAILTRLKSLHAPTLFKLSAECMAALRIDTAPHYFETSLEYAQKLNENPSETLLTYTEYLFSFKQFDTLLLLIDDLIKLDPNQHRCHYLKGESLRQIKRSKQSITSLRYAIGLAPHKAEYYQKIAKAYRAAGQTNKATEYDKAGDNIVS